MNTIIAWFARNGVAANLLMVGIIAAGILTVPQIKREVFPELPSDIVTITVAYPGAAPQEVEEGICIRIEEAVQSLEGVKTIRSTASENSGTVTVEALEGTDIRQLVDDIKSQVDAIDTFPDEAEEPLVAELVQRSQVINIALSGNTDEASIKHLGEQVRDELLSLPFITQVSLVNVRPYEVSIEVSEEAMRRHGITFDDVATAVRRSSLDLPGGSVKTSGGEILLRTKGQAYRAREFEDITVVTRLDGTRVLVRDVATVIDGFAETDQVSTFNGQPSSMVQVYRVGDQDAIRIADAVHAYVEVAETRLPEGVELTVWQDQAQLLKSRQDLLFRNGRVGFVLVFLVLALFLRFRLAFWVSLGIPLSFMGALWMMPALGVSINLISLFAFIIVLGIVVDDAIVVGESIYQQVEKGKSGVDAAIAGAQEVLLPVTFAILTTIAAFSPLLAVPGNIGQVMRVIPLIVIPTLLFSWIESKFVLPYHLSHLKPAHEEGAPNVLVRGWRRVRETVSRFQVAIVERSYRPSLKFMIRWRYLTAATFVLLLLLTVGMVGMGAVKFVFFPKVEADSVRASLTMPLGTPARVTRQAVQQLEESAQVLQKQLQDSEQQTIVRSLLASAGSQPLAQESAQSGPRGNAQANFSSAHLGEVALELIPSEDRQVSSLEVARRWRQLTGAIPEALELTFSASLFSPGSPIDIQLSGPDIEELGMVSGLVKERLASYNGVFDISDTFRSGKQEIKLDIKPQAEALGLTLSDLARQVRQGFYGEEAQRIQRGRDEVKVMVRYPVESRQSLSGLESMRIRTPDGSEVPFSSVAEAEMGRGYSSINRTDRQRTISVIADVDTREGNANEIMSDVTTNVLPNLLRDHPRVSYSLEGQNQEQADTMGGLRRGFLLAILVIYGLMAIPFRSYFQPLVVMSAIPFGVIGAIWGHVIMGKDLTVLSMFGIVALTGVVVNDSIVLVDFINRRRRAGDDIVTAVQEAGVVRFRAILLTSLTTVAGLTPMLLERSVQAQFLIPIAISLAFGVLFATFITLGMVPTLYLILNDVLVGIRRLYARLQGNRDEGEPLAESALTREVGSFRNR